MTRGNTQQIGDILKKYQANPKDRYISVEFQKYGYDLAQELGDPKHVALYIKLAKTYPRGHLETARAFVKDAYNAHSKAKLFMWKLKQLREAKTKA
jgi:hypothetical protein